MCGNGVRCFAKFIAELENLHGKQRYGFVAFSILVMYTVLLIVGNLLLEDKLNAAYDCLF